VDATRSNGACWFGRRARPNARLAKEKSEDIEASFIFVSN
jgi:hypothetical protein